MGGGKEGFSQVLKSGFECRLQEGSGGVLLRHRAAAAVRGDTMKIVSNK